MKRLENKSVIITAAGQGIGKETAIRFFNEGANVIATDINRNHKLEKLSKEFPKIKTYTLDSTNAAETKKFADSVSKVDVLINCVGFVHNGTILNCEEKDFDF
jgi:NADP-dependent 3-hydroxy acid dehydrogenase YdfG